MFRGDMPWWQQGSYVEPVTPPEADPADAPQVCVSFNRDWLPYVVGSLLQLVQPSSWTASSPSALSDVLTSATELIERFGTTEGCEVLAMRVSDCALQFSVDGGDTWVTVTDWSSYNQECLPPPPPPNPLGTLEGQNACNIATYLAVGIIQGAIAEAVAQFDLTASNLAAAGAIVGIVPGWGTFLAAALEAATGLYVLLNSGNRSAFNTAAGSSTLAGNLRCAIYGAILADGSVTADNFAAVQAAIHAVAYSPSSVQTAIDNYVAALGVGGIMQSQLSGPLYVGDCSSCPAPWCYKLDFQASQYTSTQYGAAARGGVIVDRWDAGIGWNSNGYNIGGDGFSEAGCQIGFTATYITTVEMVYLANVTSGGQSRGLFAQNPLEVSTVASLTLSSAAVGGDQTVTLTVNAIASGVAAVVRTNQNSGNQAIRSITLRGTGVNPFGASNCTP